jgi:hypothetical protein
MLLTRDAFGPRPSVASAAASCVVSDVDLAQNSEEQALLPLINQYRAQNGLQPVQTSPTLTSAASWKARDMYTHNYLSHTDSLGRGWYQLAADCGYPYASLVNVAEIAASGYSTATNVLKAWEASPAHNAMLLWSDFRAVGIANVGGYWSVIFAEQLDSAPVTPVATPTASPAPSPTPTATLSQDAVAPSVTLVQPTDGQSIRGSTTVSASATDNVGVASVRFLIDGTLYRTDTSPPYEISWNTKKWGLGTHVVTAHAVDRAGNAKSDSHTVVVTK